MIIRFKSNYTKLRTKSVYTTDKMAFFFLNDSLRRQWQFINLMSSFDKLGTLVQR